MNHDVMRPACAAALALASAALWAAPAGAADPAKKPSAACVAASSASKSAAESERTGRLRDARKAWQSCIDASCPPTSQACLTRLSSLESWMPSIVPVVTDESGAPKVDVEVKMDGEVIASELDGHGLPVEPGLHEFIFSADGKTLGTEKVLVAEGQRNRLIAISLRDEEAERRSRAASAESTEAPAAATTDKKRESDTTEGAPAPKARGDVDIPPEPVKSHGPSAWAWVFGAVGVAGLAGGAMLTYWGRHDNDQLAQCTPLCPKSSVDHIRTMYIASDIAAGVGAASALVSIWLFASSSGSSGESRPPQSAYVIDVHPAPSGAFASVSGRF